MCFDATQVNAKMANDHAQPPTIEEVLARIGHKNVLTKLDVDQAFWQIPLTEESEKYTGLLFDNQSYVFNKMLFGIKTAGALFTKAIEAAINQVPELQPNIIVCLDDVLIASDTPKQHNVNT